jgi:methylglutaconyl-CoA hydratase
MSTQSIIVEKSEYIATICLNRPEKRNAIHGPMVTELLQALKTFAADNSRVLILKGQGAHFCAGGDISWMQKMAASSEDENFDDAQLLADLLYQLYTFPKPTIALAHGASMGGGLGLLAAADMTIAAASATFCLPEVRVGITPSVISPYVIAGIGERAARYYFLTGEAFGAEKGQQLGLVQQVVTPEALQQTGIKMAQILLRNSPKAIYGAKQLIRYVAKKEITESLTQKTAEHLANLRVTPEAREGLQAFLEKREPVWGG